MAARVLVDGGLFVMYSGQYWLPEVMRRLGEHLTYRWVFAGVWQGDGNVIHPLGITSQWKPILVFSKGDWAKSGRCSDVIRMNGKEKECHEWQQPLIDVERLVEYFSSPGDLVIDPCGGGFTTAIACHRLGRRFVGCDIDKAAVASGQERLAKERVKVTIKTDPLPANSVTQGNCIDLIPRLPDGSINLCLTSPPYAEQRKGQYASIPATEYPEFTLRWMMALEPKLVADGSVLIVIRPDLKNGQINDYVLRTRLLLRESGWCECEELIWHKPDGGACMGSTKRPRRTYEHILWFSKASNPHVDPKACGRWSDSVSYRGSARFGFGGNSPMHAGQNTERKPGQTKLADVIRVPVVKIEKGVLHPAMFPTELAEILIKTFCSEGGTVLDPFAGSGTTLVAAAKHGRKGYGFDISNEYCEMARQRLCQQEGGMLVAG